MTARMRFDVDDLTRRLAEGRLDVRDWWDETLRWLEAQPNPDDAVATLFTQLAAAGTSLLVVGLHLLPAQEQHRLAPRARWLAFTERPDLADVSDLVLSWLARRGLLSLDACDPARLLGAHLDSWLAVADDEEAAIDTLHGPAHVEDQLQLVQTIADRAWPGAEQLLEIVGRDHPDTTVSKCARKELLRLRSRRVG